MNIDAIIFDQRLSLDGNYEKIAGLFCNLTGAKTTDTRNKYLLSSWYEGYIYTSLIGIRTNNRESRIGDKIEKAPKWSKNYIEQYKYLLTLLLSRPDILNELNLLNREAIKENFENVETLLDDLKKICDEYSNGGLKYLSSLYEKNDVIFNDYNSLSKIYIEAEIG